MGSIQSEDYLLCVLPFPEPKTLTDKIREEHPHLKYRYYQYRGTVDWTKDEALPEELWKDVTILLTLSQLPPRLDLAPRLKLVHLFSTGTDHFSKTAVYKEASFPITTSAGVPAPAMAEWVIMNILVASRKYNTLRQWQIEHAWDDMKGGKAVFNSASWSAGKKIGILGYGAVGRQVGNIAKSLGMEVLACTASPRKTPESKHYQGYTVPNTGDINGTIPSHWYHASSKESFHEFLTQNLDYLLVSLPLTKQSSNLIREEEFEFLSRNNTFVINIARAEILDQDCLMQCLHAYETDVEGVQGQGRKGISGAAIDVANPEPLPKNHPLWDCPNIIITPHISCITREMGPYVFQVLRANLARMATGERLLNQIDREVGYSSAFPGV